ncbi:MAG: YihY/virulence factor BrkB family protein [Bacteroidetes bacterium]|nr:YihY/virulence factor BrkB family protein [Bacteroidota bacterium]
MISLKKIYRNKTVLKWQHFFIRNARRIILPGFEGIPLYDALVFFFKGIRQSSLTSRANSLSFTFMLAIFPAIIFFFSLIPYIPIDNLHGTIMETLSEILPENAFKTVESTIQDLVSIQRTSLLSIGFFMAIYFASNGVMGIMKAFNRTSHAIETRSTLQLTVISIVLVIVIFIIVVLSATLLIFASYLSQYLEVKGLWQNSFTGFTISFSKWLIILLMLFVLISLIYYLAPANKGTFRFATAGSTLATLLALIFMMGFNFYIDNFSQYNKLYGSLGTLLILMLWINLNAIALLIGFELNASIHDAKLNNNAREYPGDDGSE